MITRLHREKMLRQRGFVAMLILVVIALSALTALTVNLWGSDGQQRQKMQTQASLKQAKAAVLAYVELGPVANLAGSGLQDAIGGRIPCPNLDGTGAINNSTIATECDVQRVSKIGVFPFLALGSPLLRDSAGECLWLAVDGNFKFAGANSVATRGTNADTNGQFTVIQPTKVTTAGGSSGWLDRVIGGSATNPADRIVAVIIAPGSSRDNQIRAKVNLCPAANVISAANYMESYTPAAGGTVLNNYAMPTANSQKTFIQSDFNHELLNDELIWITADEFAKAASHRAIRIVASILENFVYGNALTGANTNPGLEANGFYPPPAALPGGACVAGRVQGYVPGSCAGFAGIPNFDLGNRLNPAGTVANRDPEGWLSQIHYAVSPACTGTTATRTKPSAPVTNPCLSNPARLTVGTDSASVQALLLIRGRDTTGTCPSNPSDAGVIPNNLHLCIDSANQGAIANPNPAVNVTYTLPGQNSRNQMHLFRGR